jgi:molybdopterin molybdotransferase
MDGYAVRVEDVLAATLERPARLALAGKVPAGAGFGRSIHPGECVRIFTGSPLPDGADGVVMQEDTRLDPAFPNEVFVLEPAKPWENVRFSGEDVRTGAAAGESGESITAGRIGLLAALGITELEVNRQPRVALVATGSELREAGETLAPGKIYESNRAALITLIRSAGGIPEVFPIVPDDAMATRTALEKAFNQCDIVVTCGGVSVGEFDFVKAVFEQLGGELEFWKVAIKPGRPFVFGQLRGKFLFGLPGNPVSAFVTFLLLTRPALLHWQGATWTGLMSQPGRLVEPLSNDGRRRHFIRVRVDESGEVRSAGLQASHALRSLAAANGLVDVAAGEKFSAGTTVPVLRW